MKYTKLNGLLPVLAVFGTLLLGGFAPQAARADNWAWVNDPATLTEYNSPESALTYYSSGSTGQALQRGASLDGNFSSSIASYYNEATAIAYEDSWNYSWGSSGSSSSATYTLSNQVEYTGSTTPLGGLAQINWSQNAILNAGYKKNGYSGSASVTGNICTNTDTGKTQSHSISMPTGGGALNDGDACTANYYVSSDTDYPVTQEFDDDGDFVTVTVTSSAEVSVTTTNRGWWWDGNNNVLALQQQWTAMILPS